MGWGSIIAAVDTLSRETMLFAAIGFLIGGIDDIAIDLVYLRHRAKRAHRPSLDEFPVCQTPGRIAIFVAAWDEANVIGAMLRSALARIDYPDFRIYVGTYPNDPATMDAVAEVVEHDARVRLVTGRENGPTTKAIASTSSGARCCATRRTRPLGPRRWCCMMPRMSCMQANCAFSTR
uniref:glycosyltransferase n=1 Tax=Sphingomonas sp. TaxID=28214 RepID=UPI003450B03B